MKNLLLLFGMLLSTFSYGQLSPLEVVTMVFTDSDFIMEIPKYSTGRYQGIPNASTINPAYQLSFKILSQDDSTAVVNMTLDSMGNGKDLYIYLKKEGVWKIATLTELPRNNIEFEYRESLENISRQIDSLIATRTGGHQSQKDFFRARDRARLSFALDDQIIDHFKVNEHQFKQIAAELESQHILEKKELKGASLNPYISTDFKSLLIPSIYVSEFYEGCYDFYIGGEIYSRMGYLFIPDVKNVPTMNSSSLILLREIKDGWYLYKQC